MNRTLVLVSALAAATSSAAVVAQTSAAHAPAAPAATAPAIHMVDAKIAVIEYEQAVAATNEGVRALQTLQAKYQPKKSQLQAQAQEVDTLKKQLQSSSTTLSDADRASKTRVIDEKEKQLQRDGEDAQNAYSGEMQETLGAIGKKMGPVVVKYVQDNGYTMLLDNSGQQGGLSVLWLRPGTTDISQAVVDAYNTSSGVPAPAGAAAAHPHTTTPASKPAAPKQ